MGKKISDNQIKRLVNKGSTVKLKGFKTADGKTDGLITFDAHHQLVFNQPEATKPKIVKPKSTVSPTCPTCKKGKLIKGKTAYGCTLWKSGCDFKYLFSEIKKQAAGRPLTKALVLQIIKA